MREFRLIFEKLKIEKELYNFFNCFQELTIINNFNIFFILNLFQTLIHLKYLYQLNLFFASFVYT